MEIEENNKRLLDTIDLNLISTIDFYEKLISIYDKNGKYMSKYFYFCSNFFFKEFQKKRTVGIFR